jgi:PKD repeat protein
MFDISVQTSCRYRFLSSATLAIIIIIGMLFIPVLNEQSSKAQSSGASSSSSSSSSSASASAGSVIVSNEPARISKNVINSIVKSSQSRVVTTSPSSIAPLVDLETVRLGRSTFASNGFRPVADVTPFRIIGGHVSLSSPKSVKLVAATISGKNVDHAVIIDLTKVRDVKAGESIYQADLGEVITGTNPFTRQRDTVSDFTDLLLWNNSNSPLKLSDDDVATMTIIFR